MHRFLLLAMVLLIAAVNAVTAQEAEPATAKLQRELARIEAGIAEHSFNDERLVNLRVETDKLSKALIDFGVSFRPELARINARLEEMGPVPKEGEPPEPQIVASERKDLVARKAAINSELAAAERLSIRASDASARISDLRRELFANTLFRRTTAQGVFNADNWNAFRMTSARPGARFGPASSSSAPSSRARSLPRADCRSCWWRRCGGRFTARSGGCCRYAGRMAR